MLKGMARAVLALLIVVLIGCAAGLKNPFIEMQPATSSDYGYSPENPVRIGYSKNMQENIDFCKEYMASLTTKSGDMLVIVDRYSIQDPKYKPNLLRARGSMLDRYTLVSESELDTLVLYFDIYHKERLSIPHDLLFEWPFDSLSTTEN